MSFSSSRQLWALLSAVFAVLTTLFGRVGIALIAFGALPVALQ